MAEERGSCLCLTSHRYQDDVNNVRTADFHLNPEAGSPEEQRETPGQRTRRTDGTVVVIDRPSLSAPVLLLGYLSSQMLSLRWSAGSQLCIAAFCPHVSHIRGPVAEAALHCPLDQWPMEIFADLFTSSWIQKGPPA